MDQVTRLEIFAMRALWIIMWMVVKQGRVDPDDERRILKWRHDYYNAGGAGVETPPDGA